VLTCSTDVCAVVLGEGLQINCSLGCCVVPLSHIIVQDDVKDGVVSISIKCCLNEFSILPFYTGCSTDEETGLAT
jgi:hypothetical protein